MAKFGGIELGDVLGGFEIINKPATRLPQDVASAIGCVNSEPMLGATYLPIWYVGKQLVNGVNHLFIAEDIRMTKNKDTFVVALTINVPPGERAFEGEGAKVVRIVESAKLDNEIDEAFRKAMEGIVGVSYKPVAYIGKQIVSNSVNYFIVCEARNICLNAKAYAVAICINVSKDGAYPLSITPLNRVELETQPIFGIPVGDWI